MRVMFSRRWLACVSPSRSRSRWPACSSAGGSGTATRRKVARADRINSHYRAAPVPLRSALGRTGVPLPVREEWTRVTATGRYADGELQLVRNRPNDGVYGYEVVVPLDPAGRHRGARRPRLGRERGPRGRAPRRCRRRPRGGSPSPAGCGSASPSLGRQMPAGQLASINLPEARTATGARPLRHLPHHGPRGAAPPASGSCGRPAWSRRTPTSARTWPTPCSGGSPSRGVRARLRRGPPRVARGPARGRRRGRPHRRCPVRARKVRIWDEEDA